MYKVIKTSKPSVGHFKKAVEEGFEFDHITMTCNFSQASGNFVTSKYYIYFRKSEVTKEYMLKNTSNPQRIIDEAENLGWTYETDIGMQFGYNEQDLIIFSRIKTDTPETEAE